MKIGIMMRAMDQDSGFRAVVEGYVNGMLRVGPQHEYVLFYRSDKYLGRFFAQPKVKELLLRAPHKLWWDQVTVPWHARKQNVDILFNPKFSVPLISHCPVTMGLQEPAWYAWPQHYDLSNVIYMRTFLPLYVRRASYLFPNSQFILDENRRYLNRSFTNAQVAYSGTDERFRPIDDRASLEPFRVKYGLPPKFILSLTRVDHPGVEHSTSFHGGKNPETTVRAFMRIRDRVPHQLVMAGRRVRGYLAHLGFSDADLRGVKLIEWIPFDELPQLYNLAELFVIPSFYEGCPNTLLQAMACGCAIVASETGGCSDVGADAALYADPHNPDDFAAKMLRVLNDGTLRGALQTSSVARSSYFHWDRSAKVILDGMERVLHSEALPTVVSAA